TATCSRGNLTEPHCGPFGHAAAERLLDLREQFVARHVVAEIDGRGETLGVGAAVALDDDAVEPEENPAIDLSRIHLLLQRAERLARQQITELGSPRAAHRTAQIFAELACGALRGLERYVAGKALRDDDVGGAGGDVSALDEADIIKAFELG